MLNPLTGLRLRVLAVYPEPVTPLNPKPYEGCRVADILRDAVVEGALRASALNWRQVPEGIQLFGFGAEVFGFRVWGRGCRTDEGFD